MEAIHKKITKSGGITLPVSIRRELTIEAGDGMEINKTEQGIVLKPYVTRCCFCKTTEGVTEYQGKGICKTCFQEIANNIGKKNE